MALSEDILALFAKTTKDEPEETVNTTVYGTTVEYNGKIYVKIDGSDALTPISKTTDVVKDERVTVDIKNHTATVTGNVSSPAARTDDVKELGKQISEFEIVIADKVSTKELEAEKGRIDDLVSDNVTIKETLKATNADIGSLKAYDVNVGRKLTAVEAEIEDLEAKKVSAEFVEATYATIENLKATNAEVHNLNSTYGEFVVLTTNSFKAVDASIENLETSKLSAEQANLKYANIDFSNIGKAAMEYFYSQSGLIENVKIGDATITGNLIGVTIKGDLLEGGTVKADKLVVKGTDGLYYKLNTDGVKIEAEQTDYNSINGSVITAKSITASKIDVKDLVAFNATIGGLKLTEGAIYSGVKESVNNSTKGFYLDKDGQMNVGDSNSYIKYYDDADGNRKLEIAADAITFGSAKKSINDAVDDAIDSVEIGGRNLIIRSTETPNTYIEASGNVVNAANDSTSDYIAVVSGEEYVFTKTSSQLSYASVGGYFRYAWYDADKNYLGRAANSSNEIKWVAPENTSYIRISYPIDSDVKFEKGNKATDWTPAPEDVDNSITVQVSNSADETIKATEEYINTSLGNYVDQNEFIDYKDSVSAQFGVVDENIVGQIDVVEKRVEEINGELNEKILEYQKYFIFDENGLTIKTGEDSTMQLVLDNDKISFQKNGVEFGWWDGVDFHTGNIVVNVNERAQFGNFAYIPRSDGSLSFLKVGE